MENTDNVNFLYCPPSNFSKLESNSKDPPFMDTNPRTLSEGYREGSQDYGRVGRCNKCDEIPADLYLAKHISRIMLFISQRYPPICDKVLIKLCVLQ